MNQDDAPTKIAKLESSQRRLRALAALSLAIALLSLGLQARSPKELRLRSEDGKWAAVILPDKIALTGEHGTLASITSSPEGVSLQLNHANANHVRVGESYWDELRPSSTREGASSQLNLGGRAGINVTESASNLLIGAPHGAGHVMLEASARGSLVIGIAEDGGVATLQVTDPNGSYSIAPNARDASR